MNINPVGIEIQSLIIAEIRGDISDKERAYLYMVISENAEAKRLYDDMYAVLNSPEGIKAINELDSHVKVENLMVDSFPNRNKGGLQIGLSIAAMLVVIFGVCTTLWLLKGSEKEQFATVKKKGVELVMEDGKVVVLEKNDTTLNAGNISLNSKSNTLTYSAVSTINAGKGIINVPEGRFYNLVLSDGSKITLNSVTRLEFPFSFSGKTREIWIDGEAYVDVKQMADKPFIVHLPTGSVKVLGTSFNVNTYDNQEKVSLVTGKVQFVTEKDSATLMPGTEVTNIGSKLLSIHPFEKDEVLGWIDGIYVFHDTTLEDVAKVISRWYGIKIIFNENLRIKHFYGVVDRDKPIESFLDVLKLTKEITDYRIEGNVVHIN